ncbi:hypothetical protein JOM56_013776 [Amanita muscaria]
MLLDSRNREYTHLYAEQHEFLDKIRKLETRIEFLEEHQEKRERHFTETITNMGSKHSAPGKMSFVGRREEALQTAFPLAYKSEDELSGIVDPIGEDSALNFWAAGSFKPGREYPGKVAKRLRFLEDENGVPMTQKRLDVIRKFLSGAFKELKELMYELLPKKGWATGADRELMARCHLELARRFPELSYCQDGWKSRSLMVEWFPSFQRNHMPDAEIHNTVKLEDEEDDEVRTTSVPAKRVAESSKAPRKKMKKEPEPRIPELEDPLAQKPSTGRVNKESGSKTTPELTDPPVESNNLQVAQAAASTADPTPASTTSTTASTFPKPANELPQNVEPISTNTTTPMLKPSSTASTTTITNNTLDTDKSTIETNMPINGKSQADIPKPAPATHAPPFVKLPGASNVSMTGSSSASTSVTRDEQPRPHPLKLSLKLPPNPSRDDATNSSPASDAPADDELRPCSLQDVNKANLITMAGASVPEAAVNTSSGTGKDKKKGTAQKGKKAVKEYIVDPNSTAPKDLFANDYLANPDNAEKTKAVDVLRAWNTLNKEEKQVRKSLLTLFVVLNLL